MIDIPIYQCKPPDDCLVLYVEDFVVISPDPVAAIEWRGFSRTALARTPGSHQGVYDTLHKKTQASLEHLRALHDELLISADVLIQTF